MEVTLITGASGGIGEALATKLAERKHNLLLIARNGDRLAAQCKKLADTFHIRAEYIVADLGKPGAAEQIFTETQKRGLDVPMLINNAGIGSGGEFTSLSLTSELEMLQLNNASLVAMTHYFLPAMQKKKSGTLVNVASMAAYMPVPYMAVYAASKAFVRSFTEAIAEECKPYHVHVMLLSPGLTKTNFMQAADLVNQTGKALTEGAKVQAPEEVAEEALRGLDVRQTAVVSGRANKLAAKLVALVPNASLSRFNAKSYRKKMGL